MGSNANSTRPRSPEESTDRDKKSAHNKTLFLITRSCPPCWQTNNLPSGANSIAVGLDKPVATCVSVKPAGSVAALIPKQAANIQRPTKREMMKRSDPELLTIISSTCLAIHAGTQKGW